MKRLTSTSNNRTATFLRYTLYVFLLLLVALVLKTAADIIRKDAVSFIIDLILLGLNGSVVRMLEDLVSIAETMNTQSPTDPLARIRNVGGL